MDWRHLKPKKSLVGGGVVVSGRLNLMLAPGSGLRVKVTSKSLRESERAWVSLWAWQYKS